MEYKRKRQGKTDYRKRLKYLQSEKPRAVLRRSQNNFSIQLVEYAPKGDKVLLTLKASDLKKNGWKHGTGSLPAAYLTGIAFGAKAKAHAKEVVIDFGLQHVEKGSRAYAAVKGIIEGGLKVNADEVVFPKEERVFGKHVNESFEKDVQTVKQAVLQ